MTMSDAERMGNAQMWGDRPGSRPEIRVRQDDPGAGKSGEEERTGGSRRDFLKWTGVTPGW